MALKPFHSGATALRISAATELSFARTLYGRAQIIFFSVLQKPKRPYKELSLFNPYIFV